MILRTYEELITLPTFEERSRYLRLAGKIGEETFGWNRWMNQMFYTSREWKSVRDQVILRDHGCDLAVEGRDINDVILIHHMNPIGPEDFRQSSDNLLNPRYLICVSKNTHNAIHYGTKLDAPGGIVVRRPNDMCPWR